ncbi:MAG: TrbI/VirB10 family protein [Pseudomonadota bacterium]
MTAANPELAIRAKPRPVKRFNKTVLMTAVGGAALLLIGAAAYALRPPAQRVAATQELYNTTIKPMPDAFNSLPESYDGVVRDAPIALGPPLPGDLGAAFIDAPTQAPLQDNPFRFDPATLRQAQHSGEGASPVTEARASQLFFIEKTQTNSGLPSFQQPTPNVGFDPFDQLAALLPPELSAAAAPDPNRQQRKEAFLGEEVETAIYNPHSLQIPVSAYQVMAGTIIPASLITGLNSDLPGQVIAQVTEHVYDTATGTHLLIPQGTRLLGRYDSVIAFGQSRALVVWNRLILPDGSSMLLENLPGVDLAGYAGLKDKVDHHGWQLFKAAILSSVLSVGTEIGRDRGEDQILQALRDGGQQTLNQAGQEIVTRQLAVQPTVTIRPGWRLRVIVNQDLVLEPFGG